MLTAWRGVACIMVVIYHSIFSGFGLAFPEGSGLLHGVLAVVYRFWLGVPLFFVISGYCISASADAARRGPKPGAQFFWRRFRRIYPVYWAWLATAALGIWSVERMSPGFFARAFFPDPQMLTSWQWFGNITLTETWRWHLSGGAEKLILSHAWTLCYEEQFYAIVGISLLFARRSFFTVMALISSAVAVGMFLFPMAGLSTMGIFLDGKWLMFAAGALVYYTVNYAGLGGRRLALFILGVGILCAAAAPRHLLIAQVNEPNQSYLGAFAFALLIAGLHRWDSQLSQAAVLKPLRYCGEMCYSLYLVHWPVVTLVSWAFNQLGLKNPFAIFILGVSSCLAVAIAAGRLFHCAVERKFWNSRPVSSNVPLPEKSFQADKPALAAN
jgi:peptidoglycan/LPS O-acetylase OafA/YrhL